MVAIQNFGLEELGIYTTDSTIATSGKAGVDTSGGAVTLTLAPQIENENTVLIIYDSAGDFATNNATVKSGSGANVNGGTSATLSTNYKVYIAVWNGSAWIIN